MSHFTNRRRGKRIFTDHHKPKAGRHADKVTATNRHKRRINRWMYKQQLRMRNEFHYVDAE